MNHPHEPAAGGHENGSGQGNSNGHGNDSDNELQALNALVDDELSPAARAAVLGRIALDPAAQRQAAAYAAQNAALQALFAADRAPQYIVVRPRVPRLRWLAVAACWLSVGAAFGSAAAWLLPRAAGAGQPAFAQRADMAYAVYSPEQRHPVEVAATQEEHLINWLSKRLDRPLSIPPLAGYGYTLVGGRLLPGEAGPAAQFMYQNAAGERLTLYMANVTRPKTPLKLMRHGPRRTFYWTYDGVGYGLSGQIPEARLHAIAVAACRALGGDAAMWE